MTKHAIHWFEIPVTDIEHAAAFYAASLGVKLHRETFFGIEHAIFAPDSKDDASVAGALIQDAARKPAATGTVVYLATTDVDRCLRRAVAAGARIVQPRTDIGPMGVIAQIADPDGNIIGLHAESR